MIFKYGKNVFYATSCPQYLNVPCLAIARHCGTKVPKRVENWDKAQQRRRISAQNRRLTRESYLAFFVCFIVNIVLRHFVQCKRHSPGEITSLFLRHYSHTFIQSYRRKKHILPMLHAIAKLYCAYRRKQLIFNMMHIFNATKSQSRKVIKIPSLFKLKVSSTCSAVHNRINKINFLRVQEFFLVSSGRKF